MHFRKTGIKPFLLSTSACFITVVVYHLFSLDSKQNYFDMVYLISKNHNIQQQIIKSKPYPRFLTGFIDGRETSEIPGFETTFPPNKTYIIDEESRMNNLEDIQKLRIDHVRSFCNRNLLKHKNDDVPSITLFKEFSCYECRVPKTGGSDTGVLYVLYGSYFHNPEYLTPPIEL